MVNQISPSHNILVHRLDPYTDYRWKTTVNTNSPQRFLEMATKTLDISDYFGMDIGEMCRAEVNVWLSTSIEEVYRDVENDGVQLMVGDALATITDMQWESDDPDAEEYVNLTHMSVYFQQPM